MTATILRMSDYERSAREVEVPAGGAVVLIMPVVWRSKYVHILDETPRVPAAVWVPPLLGDA